MNTVVTAACSVAARTTSVYIRTRFVQKVSGPITVHKVDKVYGVLTLTVFNIVPFRSYTLRPPLLPHGNILRTPLSACLIVSSSNFV